jgi:archaellum component FlaC
VRRAQKAYRTRKDNHVTQLEKRCRELEGVVEDMTNTFIALSDTILNSGAAGSGTTKELGETMRKFLLLSEKAARDPWEAVPSSDENNEPQALIEDGHRCVPATQCFH